MPRRTNHDYLLQRHFLCELWKTNDSVAFAVLPGQAQHDLHDFYAPSISMTDEYAVTHRARMTKTFPSLPQTAGRAFEALRAHQEGQPNQLVDRHLANTVATAKVGRHVRRVRVLGVSRPEIDIYHLAHALYTLSKEDVDGSLLTLAVKAKAKNERIRRSR